MAFYDEIKVGNLYQGDTDQFLVLLSLEKGKNVISIPVYSGSSVYRHNRDGKYIEVPISTKLLTEDIRLEDTCIRCEFLDVNRQKVEKRSMTVAIFWQAFNCVAEVP